SLHEPLLHLLEWSVLDALIIPLARITKPVNIAPIISNKEIHPLSIVVSDKNVRLQSPYGSERSSDNPVLIAESLIHITSWTFIISKIRNSILLRWCALGS